MDTDSILSGLNGALSDRTKRRPVDPTDPQGGGGADAMANMGGGPDVPGKSAPPASTGGGDMWSRPSDALLSARGIDPKSYTGQTGAEFLPPMGSGTMAERMGGKGGGGAAAGTGDMPSLVGPPMAAPITPIGKGGGGDMPAPIGPPGMMGTGDMPNPIGPPGTVPAAGGRGNTSVDGADMNMMNMNPMAMFGGRGGNPMDAVNGLQAALARRGGGRY